VIADGVGDTPCIFLAGLHRAERKVAERLSQLASQPLPWPWIDADKALPWAANRLGLAYAESQSAAIRLALASKVLVITGGPGVGKTTIVKSILQILTAKGVSLLLPSSCHSHPRASMFLFTDQTGLTGSNPLDLQWLSGKREALRLTD
jgi:exodeoxyribonuclease V alpha subunit